MLIRLLKLTWLYRGFDKLRSLVVETLARIEVRLSASAGSLQQLEQHQHHLAGQQNVLHAQQHQLSAEQSALLRELSANDTSMLEALVHLVQRAPADNALAESRQAALLREVRERSDATADQLIGFGRRLGRLSDREDMALLLKRVDALAIRSEAQTAARLAHVEQTLERIVASVSESVAASARNESAVELRIAALEQAFDSRLDELNISIGALRNGVAIRADIETLAVRLGPVASGGAGKKSPPSGSAGEPDLGLMTHLAPLLSNRKALDIGANIGNYSAALLDAGFEVHAFEPNPEVFEKLSARFVGRSQFKAHAVALGSRDGASPLHLLRDVSPEHSFVDVSELSTLGDHPLPEGLEYAGNVEVPVRTLDSLHKEGLIPPEIGYVKVDAEGFDLEIVLGMGSHVYPLVSVEFWDKNLPFGKGAARNGLPALALDLQKRGYESWIVLYKVWGDNETVRFYANSTSTVDRSWGNVFFFRDRALFAEAEQWCARTLEKTDFTSSRKVRNGARKLAETTG